VPPIQKRLARVGIAKQTAQGENVASPAYSFGVLGGQVLSAEIEQENEEVTSDSRAVVGQNRLAVTPGADFTMRAYPKSLGLLLYLALGAKSVTGPVGAVYSHVFTMAQALPYCTVFGYGAGEYTKVRDAMVDSFELSWEEAGPLEVALTLLGCDLELGLAPWTATTHDKDAGGKFRAAGGTFKLDAASNVPATAKVRAGAFRVPNALEVSRLSHSVKPSDLISSQVELGMGLTIRPDNMAEWRKIVTGSAAGTAITDVPVFGSFENKFVIDANTDLTIASSRVAFMCDFPESDPSGGPVDLELEGLISEPAAGAEVTVTLRNDVPSY